MYAKRVCVGVKVVAKKKKKKSFLVSFTWPQNIISSNIVVLVL